MVFQCKICAKTFARKDSLNRHEKTVHNDESQSLVSISVPNRNDSEVVNLSPYQEQLSSQSKVQVSEEPSSIPCFGQSKPWQISFNDILEKIRCYYACCGGQVIVDQDEIDDKE